MSKSNNLPVNLSKHEFAFYWEHTSTTDIRTGDELRIEDKEFCHRLQHVVKLTKDERFLVFDQTHNIQLQLKQIAPKKFVLANVIKKEKNKILTPHITFLIPILKKEHFEHALYSLVELGAQTIQPIITQKSQKAFKIQKAYTRFSKILIAAAEQSKNFAFPSLEKPVELSQYLEQKDQNNMQFFFDPAGAKANEIIKNIQSKSYKQITLMIGPEGDLTQEEKTNIKNNGFIFCRLTPTVLRACQAVPIGLGLFRSLL